MRGPGRQICFLGRPRNHHARAAQTHPRSHETCEHLRELEQAIIDAGITITSRGQAWEFPGEWRQARRGVALEAASAPRTLLADVGVNAVNPGPYLGWSLVLGPLAIESWAEAPGNAVALIQSFHVAIVLCLALFIVLVGTTSVLGPRVRRTLLLASSLALAAFGPCSLYAAPP